MERTNANTVLALSNDESFTVLVPAAVKQACLAELRKRGKRGMAITVMLFCAALFLLLKDYLARVDRVVIDTEYTGYEATIRGMLLRWIRERHPDFDAKSIVFAQVGRNSSAHRIALRVAQGQEPPGRVLSSERILRLL